MHSPTTLVQHWFGSLRAIRSEKEIKGIQIGNKIKLLPFTDGMILYVENIEDSIHQKLLELINVYQKVAR